MSRTESFLARPLRTHARRAVLLLAALSLGACGSRAVKQPEITLESVQVGGLGLRGGTLLVNVSIHNPNRFALNANQMKYDLAIRDAYAGSSADTSWIDFANGIYNQPFAVGGRATESVEIPVEFSYSGFGSAAASILRSGTFTYRAAGTVDVRTPLGTYVVPFTRRGTVTLAGVR